MEDHVLLLSTLSRTCEAAEMVKEAKRGSSLWLKTKGPDPERWVELYGDYSLVYAATGSQPRSHTSSRTSSRTLSAPPQTAVFDKVDDKVRDEETGRLQRTQAVDEAGRNRPVAASGSRWSLDIFEEVLILHLISHLVQFRYLARARRMKLPDHKSLPMVVAWVNGLSGQLRRNGVW